VGFAVESIPLVAVLYDLCAFGSALFASLLSWRLKKEQLLKAAIVVQAIAHATAFFAHTEWLITASGVLFGVHIGMSQGTLLSMISGFSGKSNMATAFSVYYVVVAFSLLLSNILAGKLNAAFNSPSGAFAGGALFSVLALVLLNFLKKPKCHRFAHQTEGNPPF
jgi:MFS-type transporter involved in bile tolerance (Atg22 family)